MHERGSPVSGGPPSSFASRIPTSPRSGGPGRYYLRPRSRFIWSPPTGAARFSAGVAGRKDARIFSRRFLILRAQHVYRFYDPIRRPPSFHPCGVGSRSRTWLPNTLRHRKPAPCSSFCAGSLQWHLRAEQPFIDSSSWRLVCSIAWRPPRPPRFTRAPRWSIRKFDAGYTYRHCCE